MLDPIRARDTDLLTFDFSVPFPAGIDETSLNFESTPPGFQFTGEVVNVAQVQVYFTAPSKVGNYVLRCSATDNSPLRLTLSEPITVTA